LAQLCAFRTQEDIAVYLPILQEVFKLFGEGIQESLTRTMGEYLEATGGQLANTQNTQLEKDSKNTINRIGRVKRPLNPCTTTTANTSSMIATLPLEKMDATSP
jgi:hypothetical protein